MRSEKTKDWENCSRSFTATKSFRARRGTLRLKRTLRQRGGTDDPRSGDSEREDRAGSRI